MSSPPLPPSVINPLRTATTPWSEQVTALHSLVSLCLAHPAPPPPILLRQLRSLSHPLSLLLSDLRSSLIREACLAISTLSSHFGPPLVHVLAPHVLPALLRRAPATVAVIRDSCVSTALAMLHHGASGVPLRTADLIATVVANKKTAPAGKLAAAKMIGVMMQDGWRGTEATLKESIMRGCQSSDEAVRMESRANWRRLQSSVAADVLAKVPPQVAAFMEKEAEEFREMGLTPPSTRSPRGFQSPKRATTDLPRRAPQRVVPVKLPSPEKRQLPDPEHIRRLRPARVAMSMGGALNRPPVLPREAAKLDHDAIPDIAHPWKRVRKPLRPPRRSVAPAAFGSRPLVLPERAEKRESMERVKESRKGDASNIEPDAVSAASESSKGTMVATESGTGSDANVEKKKHNESGVEHSSSARVSGISASSDESVSPTCDTPQSKTGGPCRSSNSPNAPQPQNLTSASSNEQGVGSTSPNTNAISQLSDAVTPENAAGLSRKARLSFLLTSNKTPLGHTVVGDETETGSVTCSTEEPGTVSTPQSLTHSTQTANASIPTPTPQNTVELINDSPGGVAALSITEFPTVDAVTDPSSPTNSSSTGRSGNDKETERRTNGKETRSWGALVEDLTKSLEVGGEVKDDSGKENIVANEKVKGSDEKKETQTLKMGPPKARTRPMLRAPRRSIMPGTKIELDKRTKGVKKPTGVGGRVRVDKKTVIKETKTLEGRAKTGGESQPGKRTLISGISGKVRTGVVTEKRKIGRGLSMMIDWLKRCRRVRHCGWQDRVEAMEGFCGACQKLQGERIGPRLAEDCIAMMETYVMETHGRLLKAGLDGLFFLFLCCEGSCGVLRRGLEKHEEVVKRVLGLMVGGKEDIRLGAQRVMRGMEVQFRPEIRVGLVMRVLEKGVGAGVVDGRMAEVGCKEVKLGVESGDGFIWEKSMLERVLKGMDELMKDRRASVRRAAVGAVEAVKNVLPDGAFTLACEELGLEFGKQ